MKTLHYIVYCIGIAASVQSLAIKEYEEFEDYVGPSLTERRWEEDYKKLEEYGFRFTTPSGMEPQDEGVPLKIPSFNIPLNENDGSEGLFFQSEEPAFQDLTNPPRKRRSEIEAASDSKPVKGVTSEVPTTPVRILTRVL